MARAAYCVAQDLCRDHVIFVYLLHSDSTTQMCLDNNSCCALQGPFYQCRSFDLNWDYIMMSLYEYTKQGRSILRKKVNIYLWRPTTSELRITNYNDYLDCRPAESTELSKTVCPLHVYTNEVNLFTQSASRRRASGEHSSELRPRPCDVAARRFTTNFKWFYGAISCSTSLFQMESICFSFQIFSNLCSIVNEVQMCVVGEVG